jgi:hypothetical protein
VNGWMDAFVPLLATLIPPEKQTFCWRTYLLCFTVLAQEKNDEHWIATMMRTATL